MLVTYSCHLFQKGRKREQKKNKAFPSSLMFLSRDVARVGSKMSVSWILENQRTTNTQRGVVLVLAKSVAAVGSPFQVGVISQPPIFQRSLSWCVNCLLLPEYLYWGSCHLTVVSRYQLDVHTQPLIFEKLYLACLVRVCIREYL